jgi:23S rRNA pseudouridine2605 synthase
VASRRQAEELIRTGRVSVNGLVVRELGARADPARDEITLDGERLAKRPPSRTIALHKPRGVVSTLADPEGRPTVRELVAELGLRVYPVGRLDLQSSGLLLLTNDGALAQGLLHPRRGVERVYHVKVHGSPDARALGRLRRGIRLEEGLVVPSRVRRMRALPHKTWLEIGLREGRKHVVRRLCASLGLPVDKLVRVRLGPVQLGDLPPGAWRALTPTELGVLRRAAGLTPARAGGAAAKARRSRARGTLPRTPPRPRERRPPPAARAAPRAGSAASSPRPSRPRQGRPRA